MRIKSGCKLREMAGEWVVITPGKAGVDLTRIVTLNPTSRLLWQELGSEEFSVEDVADILCRNFDVERELALKDAQSWVLKLKSAELLD